MPVIRTAADLGALIKDRRKQLRMDQATLAQRVGVSRQWVIAIEHGRATAELGLVMRALDVLGIPLATQQTANKTTPPVPAVNLDRILADARKKSP
jgi:HTH-type transcriptional regulator/antitoxin HipB